jgi:hypothetical protein
LSSIVANQPYRASANSIVAPEIIVHLLWSEKYAAGYSYCLGTVEGGCFDAGAAEWSLRNYPNFRSPRLQLKIFGNRQHCSHPPYIYWFINQHFDRSGMRISLIPDLYHYSISFAL